MKKKRKKPSRFSSFTQEEFTRFKTRSGSGPHKDRNKGGTKRQKLYELLEEEIG